VNDERARKNESVILQALAARGQDNVAREIGVSESTISRFKAQEIARLSQLLAVCGLKVVPEHLRCYPEEHIEHLQYFAQRAIRLPPQELSWEEAV